MKSRNEWFAALAALAYPADPSKAQQAFGRYLPWFNDLPEAAFTKPSLEKVVVSPRRMAIPSYDEIRKPLGAWWRDNGPADVRLQSEYPRFPSPASRGEPTSEELQALAVKLAALKADLAVYKAGKPSVRQLRLPKPLSDAQLLLEYQRTAFDEQIASGLREIAMTRVHLLRAKLTVVQASAGSEVPLAAV